MAEVRGTRTQWSVGQGLFHSGAVEIDGQRLHYVYDCGSQKSYGRELRREIDRYLDELPDGERVTVYLSHLHYDHVSGLDRLLRSGRVEQVVMPLLPPSERLLVLGAALASSERRALAPSWYVDLLAEPVTWLRSRAEDATVTLVLPDDGVPGGAPDGPQGDERRRDGAISRPGSGLWSARDAAVTCGGPASSETLWVLLPWILRDVTDRRDEFMRELVAACSPRFANVAELLDEIGRPEGMVRFAKDHRAELRIAYEMFADLNLTSLHLYSGPARSPRTTHRCTGRIPFGATTWHWSNRPVGWLGTGDAPLKAATRAEEFYAAFRDTGRMVGTMVLPHHGADSSFNPTILEAVPAGTILVAPADAYSTWMHPGPVTTRASSVRGELVVVTSQVNARWHEEFDCTW